MTIPPDRSLYCDIGVQRWETNMTTMTFVNLPVKDLAKTIAFFTSMGFAFNEQFSDDNTGCMVISDDAYAMLHVEARFEGFAGQRVTDTSTSREVIIGLSAASRDEVDDRVDKALAAGGQPFGEPVDDGFMYMRALRDLDGHQWSFIYMDMSGIG